MGINSEFKKLDVEIQMFIKSMETNLTNIIASLNNLDRVYKELAERLDILENKVNN